MNITNYYNCGMLEYTFRKELIAYLVKHGLPIRALQQQAKYSYKLYKKNSKWLTTYYFSGANYNSHHHPRSLDVRIAYKKLS